MRQSNIFGVWCSILLVSAAIVGLSGCASFHMGLEDEERAAVQRGDRALVLIRARCNISGVSRECFENPTWRSDGPLLAFGLGSFDTVGEPRPVSYGFLSEESRSAGWFFFVLPQGIHYLAVTGPRSSGDFRDMQRWQRWRIDVPEDAGLVYAGTLDLHGRDNGELLFGGRVIVPSTDIAIGLTDETSLAKHLLSAHRENALKMETHLMQRWQPGTPIIIRSPKTLSAH